MNYEELENAILNNNIDYAKNKIRELGDKKIKEASVFLLKYLKITENNILRNCIAIALSDIGCEEAVGSIISLIKDPKTIGGRGSLLYALRNLNYLDYIDDITNLIFDNNFEVSRESFILIENISNKIPIEKRKDIKQKLSDEKKNLKDKIDFINDGIKMLNKIDD